MKTRISILAFAAALASVALSDDTTWWYTPDGGWKNTVTVGLATGSGGSLGTFTFSADHSEATIYGALKAAIDASGETQSAKNAYALACRALAQAIHADAVNARQDEKIKTLGDTLETFLYADTAEFKDSGGDVVGSYERDSGTAATVNSIKAARRYIASGAPVDSGRGAVVTHTIKKDFFNDKNITLQTDGDGKSYALRGFSDLSASAGDEELGGADRWALDYKGYYIPVATGASSNMGWARWNGWDANIFSAGHDIATGHINDQPLYLNGWYADDASCDTKFQNILTNAYSGTDRREHWILSRYKHGSANPVIHWIPFDEEALDVGKEPVADDKSVEYTQDENAQADDPKKFRVKGFATANSAAASDTSGKSAKLPLADGSTELQWKKPIDLFNSSVFDADSSGKVILKATVAEEGKTEVMTITQSGSGGSVSSQTLEGKTLDYLTDGASLGSVEVSGDDKIGIKSWDRPQDTKASYTIASRLKLTHTDALDNPTTSPAVLVRDDGVLKYTAIGCLDPIPPIDGVSITTNSEDGAVYDGVLSIFGYADAEEGDYLRVGAEGLEWTPLAEYDGISIETNDVGQVGIVGFEEALASLEGESDGALVPYIDSGSTELQWGGMMEFFADSVFRQSETTGKILLNGTSEEGKVKVLAMTGNGGDDQHVNALTFDARSVDGANGVVQVHGFDMAPSPFGDGVNFADALTNMNVSTANMSVPLRVPVTNGNGYEVMYAPLAKVTGIPAAPVDDITIEVNQEDPLNPKLQLHGAAGDGITLEEGDVYMIGSDGKGKFGKGTGADGDDSEVESGFNSLESYSNTDGDRFLRLKGWDTSYETPHVVGKDGDMKYYEVNGGGGIETHTSGAGDQLQLSGYDTAANGALPYKVNDGNGISWLAGVDDRVPLLHTSGVPTTMAIGGSLDKANVSAVPTLNVSGFTAGGNCTAKLNTMLSDPNDGSNRSAHQFMARYSSGGGTPTVHWVSIDDVIAGGGSPVDDTSITTNTSHGASSDGVASIFGFSTASAGDIPHKTDDGKIEWKPVANGGALIVSGTSGSTVTTATCTNKLSFVSAPDSNVKFTVTDKGDGNVEVKIGVYYLE